MKISTAIQHKSIYQENQKPFSGLGIFLIMYVMLNRHTALAEQGKALPLVRTSYSPFLIRFAYLNGKLITTYGKLLDGRL